MVPMLRFILGWLSTPGIAFTMNPNIRNCARSSRHLARTHSTPIGKKIATEYSRPGVLMKKSSPFPQ